MALADVDAIAQGRVWTGAKAQENGLVDAIGGIDDAIASAATLAGLDEYETIYLEKGLSPQEQLLQQLLDAGVSLGSGLPNQVLTNLQRELGALMTITSQPGVYLHCLSCSINL